MIKRLGKLALLIIVYLASVAIVSAVPYITISSSNAVTVNNGTPTLTLSSNSTTVYTGDTLLLTATLSDGLTGVNVTFYLNNTAVGWALTDSGGIATYTLLISSGYTGGTYTATAQYPHP